MIENVLKEFLSDLRLLHSALRKKRMDKKFRRRGLYKPPLSEGNKVNAARSKLFSCAHL